MLTQELVQSLFNYDNDTGILTHKFKKSNNGKANAGEEAGWIRKGYKYVKVQRKAYPIHRIAFLYCHGYMPECIDHIDRNPLNNCISNLRPASYSQNNANSKRRSDNTTGFKGVSKFKGRFRADISINGTRKHLGIFDTPEEAHKAYCLAASEAFGDFFCAG